MAELTTKQFSRFVGARPGPGEPEDGDEPGLAAGTGVRDLGSAGGIYQVRVFYREPSFETRVGRREEPFRWTYRVRAASAEEARAIARREFDETARQSSVGWTREIVGMSVRVAPGY